MLKSAGYLSGRMQVPVPQQHQILIRATSKGATSMKGIQAACCQSYR